MVFQERRVHRLREQMESMMEANRRCDVMRRRQEAFLGHLIEKYQGDNVPLTADLCRQYCALFEVRQKIYMPFSCFFITYGVVLFYCLCVREQYFLSLLSIVVISLRHV